MEYPSIQATALQAIIAALLAVGLDWFPKLRDWWQPIDASKKKIYMGLAMIISLVALAAIDCLGGDTCPAIWSDYILGLVAIYLGGVAVNQGTHSITKPSK